MIKNFKLNKTIINYEKTSSSTFFSIITYTSKLHYEIHGSISA
ncbi:hypothetical protein OAG36_01075 [bacterium]|nr:hypothetical protein [bacterium]